MLKTTEVLKNHWILLSSPPIQVCNFPKKKKRSGFEEQTKTFKVKETNTKSERNVLLPPDQENKGKLRGLRGNRVPDAEWREVVGMRVKGSYREHRENRQRTGKTLPGFCVFLALSASCFSELVGMTLSSGEIHKTEDVPQHWIMWTDIAFSMGDFLCINRNM